MIIGMAGSRYAPYFSHGLTSILSLVIPSDSLQASFRQGCRGVHAIVGGSPFVRRFVEGVARGCLDALRFRAIHGEHGTFAVAAQGEARPARVPLGEDGAD